jgi:Holliday junction resolvase RusA-like endonuclease
MRARAVRRRKLGQRTRFVVHDNDSALRVWREAIAATARAAGVGLGLTRVVAFRVRLVFYLPRVGPGASFPEPTYRRDLDKHIRSVLDALKGVAWHDDGQVTDIQAVKVWAWGGRDVVHPGVAITVEEAL